MNRRILQVCLLLAALLGFSLGAKAQFVSFTQAAQHHSGGGPGNFTFVNGTLCSGTSPNICSFSPTAGHGIILGAYGCGDTGACTASASGITLAVSDNVNNPETCFTAAPSSPVAVNDSGGFHEVWYWWVCPSIPAGVTSFTITNSSGTNYSPMWISEWSGTSFTGVIDKDGHAQSATSGTSASVSTTAPTTNAQDVCVGMIDNDNDETQTIGGAWTAHFNDGHGNGVLQSLLTSSTGTQTATATWTGSDTWFGEIVCVK